ncbi:hypothetical protein [Microcystis aeruginosa]|uniref:Uncharacterized protein n=1 Tax=Microcystis aeruginosa PCC 9808 TaxID=1160284 RepID=I4HWZ6_MICAE|nr:hypothetical protein [Microcystis aeruginosa]MDB9411189.1 hypothetical protein [Microcystis aeruginosa CS-567/02]MDB9427778.1 hypothetical protein [Microcystis aeruginosa CS-555/01A07]CCI26570.1 hypothetical protein MICAG_3140003 [Microcystis aeruginosa PCC 9808]
MKITIEYLGEIVEIETPDNNPDSWHVPKITVPEDLQDLFDLDLKRIQLHGHYGHLVDIRGDCSNLDLQACFYMQDFEKATFPFKLISVEPQIFPNPNFPPPGAVS